MQDRLAACRQFYAKMVAAGGGQLREDLERAFEIVPREYFLGPGPWLAVSSLSGMFVATPTDDPIHVYQNVLFALDRKKQINNGEPFLHGQLLGALAPARGNVALHIGCGTGYYTAILAHLVGPSGKVIAYEIEPELARAGFCQRRIIGAGRTRLRASGFPDAVAGPARHEIIHEAVRRTEHARCLPGATSHITSIGRKTGAIN